MSPYGTVWGVKLVQRKSKENARRVILRGRLAFVGEKDEALCKRNLNL